MSLKSILKEARKALDGGEYVQALQLCKKALKQDKLNYMAICFMGVAACRLEEPRYEDAEKAFLKATKIDATQGVAWQGLRDVYQPEALHKLPELIKVLTTLSDLTRDNKGRYVQYQHELARAMEENEDLLGAASVKKSVLHLVEPHEQLQIYDDILHLHHQLEEASWPSDVHKEDFKMWVEACLKLDEIYNEMLSPSSPLSSDLRCKYYETFIGLRERRAKLAQKHHMTEWKDLWCLLDAECRQMHAYFPQSVFPLEMMVRLSDCEFDDASAKEVRVSFVAEKLAKLEPDNLFGRTASAYLHVLSLKGTIPHCGYFIGIPRTLPSDITHRLATAHQLLLDTHHVAGNSKKKCVLWYICSTFIQLMRMNFAKAGMFSREGLKLVDDLIQQGFLLENVASELSYVAALSSLCDDGSPSCDSMDDFLEQRPHCRAALQAKAWYLFNSERIKESREVIENLLAIEIPHNTHDEMGVFTPNDRVTAWAYAQQAWFFNSSDKNPGEAIIVLKKAIALDHNDYVYHYSLALIQWECGGEMRSNKQNCFANFLLVARLCPSFSPVYEMLGKYYEIVAADKIRAIKCFRRALELSENPDEEMALKVVKLILGPEGQNDISSLLQAASVYRKIVEISCECQWAWERLASVNERILFLTSHSQDLTVLETGYEHAGKDAVFGFQQALRLNERNHRCWAGLGRTYTLQRKPEAALGAFIRATDLVTESPLEKAIYTCDVARVQMELGLFEEAAESYYEVLQSSSLDLKNPLMRQIHTLVHIGMADAQHTWALHLARGGQLRGANERIRKVTELLGQKQSRNHDIIQNAITLLEEASCLHVSSDGRQTVSIVKKLGDACLTAGHVSPFGLEYYEKAITAYENAMEIDSSQILLSWDLACAHRDAAQECMRNPPPEDKKAKGTRTHQEAAVKAMQYCCAHLNDPVSWQGLAVTLMNRDAGMAQHSYITSLRMDPKNISTWLNLGLLYIKQNRWSLARRAFSHAHRLHPTHAAAWTGLGLIAEATKQGCIDLWWRAMDVDSEALSVAQLSLVKNALLLLSSSTHTITHSQVRRIIQTCEDYLWLFPHDAWALYALGVLCSHAGKGYWNRGLSALCSAHSLFEKDHDTIMQAETLMYQSRVLCRMARGSIQGAVGNQFSVGSSTLPLEKMKLVMSLNSKMLKDPRAWCLLAGCYLTQAEPKETVVSLSKALELDKNYHPTVTHLLAVTYAVFGNIEAAKQYAVQHIQSLPKSSAAWYLLCAIGLWAEDPNVADNALHHASVMEDAHRNPLMYLLRQRREIHDSRALVKMLHAYPTRGSAWIDLACVTASKAVNNSGMCESDDQRRANRKAAALKRAGRFAATFSESASLLSFSASERDGLLDSSEEARRLRVLAVSTFISQSNEADHGVSRAIQNAQKALRARPDCVSGWLFLRKLMDMKKNMKMHDSELQEGAHESEKSTENRSS